MFANSLPGGNVFLSVNGYALHEYESEMGTSDSKHTVTSLAYVEAVVGAAFAVNVSLDPAFGYSSDDLKIDVHMDGNCIRSKYMDLSKGRRSAKVDRVHEASGGQRVIRRFLFAEHQTTDDKPDPLLKSKFEKLGEVTVFLTRCRIQSTKPKTLYASPRKVLNEVDIPEKALKGKSISNHIKMGEIEKSCRRVHSVQASYPYGKKPLAAFTFKYRSHRDLQVEGIIARSPSPIPLEDRDPQDLTAEEARELVCRLRARVAPGVKPEHELKQESSVKRQRPIDLRDDDEPDDVTLISFNSAIRGKRTRTEPSPDMEVLDLTAD